MHGEGDNRRVEEPFLLNPVFPDGAKNGKVVDVAANDGVSLAIVEEKSSDAGAENGEQVQRSCNPSAWNTSLQVRFLWQANGNGNGNGHAAEKKRHLLSWGLQTNYQLGRNTEDD